VAAVAMKKILPSTSIHDGDDDDDDLLVYASF